MKKNKRNTIMTLTLVACLLLLTLTSQYVEGSIMTSSLPKDTQVIILDAGHGGYVLSDTNPIIK